MSNRVYEQQQLAGLTAAKFIQSIDVNKYKPFGDAALKKRQGDDSYAIALKSFEACQVADLYFTIHEKAPLLRQERILIFNHNLKNYLSENKLYHLLKKATAHN